MNQVWSIWHVYLNLQGEAEKRANYYRSSLVQSKLCYHLWWSISAISSPKMIFASSVVSSPSESLVRKNSKILGSVRLNWKSKFDCHRCSKVTHCYFLQLYHPQILPISQYVDFFTSFCAYFGAFKNFWAKTIAHFTISKSPIVSSYFYLFCFQCQKLLMIVSEKTN